jgi:hypothetical protein
VSHRPTISHGFLAAATADVRQARAVALVDASLAVVAVPADAREQAAACMYYVPSAVAGLA